jgi:hypothetical protein
MNRNEQRFKNILVWMESWPLLDSRPNGSKYDFQKALDLSEL